MYLFCYARSEEAIETGNKLLKNTDGEWISDIESFTSNPPETVNRADGAIVMILPAAASIKLIIERIYPSDIAFPVITVSPEGKWAGVLRKGGYNAYEILNNVCQILNCTALSKEDDRKHYVPNLNKCVKNYNMVVDSKDMLNEINNLILDGQKIDIYTDLSVTLGEPVLDSLSFGLYHYHSSQLRELCQAYVNACKSNIPAVFITYNRMPEVESKGKVLILTPKKLVVGVEISQRADAEYASSAILNSLKKHSINPAAIKTVATVSSAMDNKAIEIVAKDLETEVRAYDSKIVKSVKLPYDGSFGQNRGVASDICTATASLASDNGKILAKRIGDISSAFISIACEGGEIII